MELLSKPISSNATLIEKLPAELIERILLEVSTHEVSPSTSCSIDYAKLGTFYYGPSSSDYYTIRDTFDDSSPDDNHDNISDIVNDSLPAPLDFRFTCRTFRNLSWRALAMRLGETVFDLCSRQSFSNLMAVSSCEYLAPWITKLTIACNGRTEEYPYVYSENSIPAAILELDESLFYDLMQVKEDEHTWYPGIWERWPETSLEIPSRDVPVAGYQQVDTRLLEKVLASALQSFCNLNHLCYVNEPHARPGRYNKCYRPQEPTLHHQVVLDFSSASEYYYAGYIAHVGLEILFRAIASSGTAVHTMDLAVDLVEHHAFITNAPPALVAKISQKVETLILRDAYCPFFDDNGSLNEPRISITSSTFPSLHHLTIDHNGIAPDTDVLVTPYPSLSDRPSLLSLSIENARSDHGTLLSFIRAYGAHARRITFKDMMYPDFGGLLKIIGEFDLEELRIHHDPKQRRPDDTPYKILVTLPQFVQNAARTVVISPPGLRDALERGWKRG